MNSKTATEKFRKTLFITIFWLMLLPLYTGAATADKTADITTAIAPLVDKFLSQSHSPGVQVAILNKSDEKPITIAKGMADLSNTVPMTDEHICKMGSITKMFTALAIHLLIQEKKLAYDTPLSTFFPDFPNADNIEIRHLLTHTSGLVKMLTIKNVFENLCKPLSASYIMGEVQEVEPLFAPGIRQKYCNTGYLVLGKVIEKITGHSFETEIQSRVLPALGMTHTRQGDDLTLIKKEARGYRTDKSGEIVKAANASMVPPLATGNFIGNAADIVRFVHIGRLLKNNFIDTPFAGFWVLDTGKPAVTTGTYKQLAYEMGWRDGYAIYRITAPEKMTLKGKAGMFQGFCAWFLYDAQTQYGLAITVNDETKSMDALILAVNIFQTLRRS